jgi:predicted nucleic acid-binding protein
MSGNRYLIDTNIAIYLMGGDERIADLLHENYIYLSFITELELYAFKDLDKKETKLINDFISTCTVIDINRKIKDYTIEFRKKYKLKLPDCILAATAQYLAIPLFTADADFKPLKDLSLIYYEPGDEG